MSSRLRALVQDEQELTPAEKLRVALDLSELAEEMVRARTLRERPDATRADVARAVEAWYATRPGAEHGDATGVPGTWPRRPRRP